MQTLNVNVDDGTRFCYENNLRSNTKKVNLFLCSADAVMLHQTAKKSFLHPI